jgi:outer membrane protein OmpA-like peptidoglycan-associated protein
VPNFTQKIIIAKLMFCFAIFYLSGAAYAEEARGSPSLSQSPAAAYSPDPMVSPKDYPPLEPIAYTDQNYSSPSRTPAPKAGEDYDSESYLSDSSDSENYRSDSSDQENYLSDSSDSAYFDSESEFSYTELEKEIKTFLTEDEIIEHKDSILVWKDNKLYRNNQDGTMTLLDASLAVNKGVSGEIFISEGIKGINGFESSVVLQISHTVVSMINFELDSSVILPDSFDILEAFGDHLNSPALKDYKLLVRAHTCNIGTFAYNQRLSEDRAKSVKNWLSDNMHVDENRIISVGASFSAPIADNDTEEGRAQNRRVEFVLLRPQNQEQVLEDSVVF